MAKNIAIPYNVDFDENGYAVYENGCLKLDDHGEPIFGDTLDDIMYHFMDEEIKIVLLNQVNDYWTAERLEEDQFWPEKLENVYFESDDYKDENMHFYEILEEDEDYIDEDEDYIDEEEEYKEYTIFGEDETDPQ